MQFQHRDYASKAEKSWKQIARSLQSILGCHVEIRINIAHCVSYPKHTDVRKPSFSLFNCSRRMQHKSHSSTERGSDSDLSEHMSEKAIIRDRPNLNSTSSGDSQKQHKYHDRLEVMSTLRDNEGNALSTGTTLTHRSLENDMPNMSRLGVKSSTEEGSNRGSQDLSIHKPADQPNCFPRKLRFQKKLCSSDSSQMILPGIENGNKLAFSIPQTSSFETYISAQGPYVFCSSSNNHASSSRDDNG